MSAIWGIVDLSVAQSEAQRKNRAGNLWEEVLRMRQAYRTSCLDRIQEKREATYYLACGVQNVTREAVEERFPYERKGERRSLFVADVILDNRGELVQRFGDIRDLCSHPDGEILYESFCSHPEETLAVARGAYACAYLEPGKRTLTLFNDAVGNRSVYYFQEEKGSIFPRCLRGSPANGRTGRKIRVGLTGSIPSGICGRCRNPERHPMRGSCDWLREKLWYLLKKGCTEGITGIHLREGGSCGGRRKQGTGSW